MRVLSVIHQADAASGVFGDAAREAGHELVEWNVTASSTPPFDPDAVLVFGGSMHVDQEERHGWLRNEDALLRDWLAGNVPILGICLGGQLLAKALDAEVRPMPSPEIGWFQVELTPAARRDPVFGGLPTRLDAFQWHSYCFELPAGAVALADGDRCLQAFRAGDSAWGLQFHAEVTRETLGRWIRSSDAGDLDHAGLHEQSEQKIGRWNAIGKEIGGRFLAAAEAIRAAVTIRATSPGS
jgi:GMP synthase (glutamine-hydrolysing)